MEETGLNIPPLCMGVSGIPRLDLEKPFEKRMAVIAGHVNHGKTAMLEHLMRQIDDARASKIGTNHNILIVDEMKDLPLEFKLRNYHKFTEPSGIILKNGKKETVHNFDKERATRKKNRANRKRANRHKRKFNR